MLNSPEGFFIIVITVAVSLVFMAGLNRIWPWQKRHTHNDLIGWQLSILANTYAVVLGFMLYAVWTNFGAADLNADNEANALVSTYRLAEGLPAQQRAQLQALARSYARSVVDRDWPQMANNQIPQESHAINTAMWKTLMSVKAATPVEITAEDHAISELSAMTEHRRTRLLQSAARLPTVLWGVLIIGGALALASASMFGSGDTSLHALQVFAFSLFISLVLVAIADINRPFQGSVHVTSDAFQRAQQNMKD